MLPLGLVMGLALGLGDLNFFAAVENGFEGALEVDKRPFAERGCCLGIDVGEGFSVLEMPVSELLTRGEL